MSLQDNNTLQSFQNTMPQQQGEFTPPSSAFQALSQSVINSNTDMKHQHQHRTLSFVNNLKDTQVPLRGSLYQNQIPNLLLPQVNFVGEEKFKKDLECFVCKSPFGTVKDRQHHCRCCGNSCCKLCSSRSINSQRVCDICFLKATQLSYEKKRRRFIKAMKEHIEKMTAFSKAGEQRIIQLDQEHETERQKLEDETKSLKGIHIDLQMQQFYQEEEKRKLTTELQALNQLMGPKILLKEKLQVQELDVDQKLRQLDTDIFLKSQTLEEKRKHYEKLKLHLSELEQSDSFINLSLYQEAAKQEPNHISEKIITMSNSKLEAKNNQNEQGMNRSTNQNKSSQLSSTNSENLANQLYDTKMLDREKIDEIMNKDKDHRQYTTRQIQQPIAKEWDACSDKCEIF